jgi:dTDP-4-amino-4,6-dideoxygalactose transaminase
MGAIVDIARTNDLAIVEDAAQAVGALVDTTPVGSYGLGCFSLYATKNVTTGEGGIITTDDSALADRLRLLRNQGMRARYEYAIPGHNYRMTDLQAAIGVAQMARLDEINKRRRRNAVILSTGLAGVEGLGLPSEAQGRFHVFHQYTIRVSPEARLNRNGLAAALAERGIETGVYYPRVVMDYDCYRDHPNVVSEPIPNARRAADEVLSLPIHPGLSDSDLEQIVDGVRTVLGS